MLNPEFLFGGVQLNLRKLPVCGKPGINVAGKIHIVNRNTDIVRQNPFLIRLSARIPATDNIRHFRELLKAVKISEMTDVTVVVGKNLVEEQVAVGKARV